MQLTNISAGGCFVATAAVVPIASRITVHASIDGADVPLVGRVVHVQPGRGFGFEIDLAALPASARQRLEKFLSPVESR